MPVLPEALIVDFIGGDEQAFARIYEMYHSDVNAYCYKHTRSYETAEELTSDVFLRLWEGRANLDPERDIRPYLLTITRNVSFSWLKRMLTDQRMKSEFRQRYHDAQKDTNPDLVMTAAADLSILRRIIHSTMPVERRQVFELCKIDGMSYAEAAKVLSVSKETIKEHMSLARKDMGKLADAADYIYMLVPVLLFFF